MLRRDRAHGVRFLVGLAVGGTLAGAVLAVLAYLVGSAVQAILPMTVRLWLLALASAAFGLADLANRTPHVWRQVPQRFVHRLTPGVLGLVWGFDLGLLVTTQKVASLIWVSVTAVVLLEPTAAAGVLVGIALIASVVVTAWSMSERTSDLLVSRKEHQWVTIIRRASGLALLILALLAAIQAWGG
ncbi:hypothetical protein [Nonomuraea africana]|uniref:Lysylphosphatidylglycerol synthetase-like protein (DUF2156 family) n=1 Tax=Nonomuraea africana TaxID=46171 RepID=A0ABR9KIU7_9ACTN|nr:hypothetical protein [Nonomuraea africana]MBE1561952.1 lysylphosphatidylglycerol synthetase-like protein (DUF2156 family) [Nonomuraea africana]